MNTDDLKEKGRSTPGTDSDATQQSHGVERVSAATCDTVRDKAATNEGLMTQKVVGGCATSGSNVGGKNRTIRREELRISARWQLNGVIIFVWSVQQREEHVNKGRRHIDN
jgi:hypothetical protein